MRKSGRKIAIIPVAALLSLAFAAHAGAAPPANTAAPTVTGTPKVGEVLTAQNGTWANNPTAFQYQWQRCNAAGAACANIGTATLKTYTVATPDSGRTLRVRVTAVNAEGATNARSAPTAVVPPNAGPQNQQRPSIEGEAKAGEELALDAGTWEPDATSYAYQWQRCDFDALNCLNVGGATGETYGVRNADVGYRLRVLVTARNAQGAGTATSNISDVVAPAVDPEQQADDLVHLGRLPRQPRLCAVPRLRRRWSQPDRPRHRLAAGPCLPDAALLDARRPEPVRRLHPQLAAREALPRRRPVHADASRP